MLGSFEVDVAQRGWKCVRFTSPIAGFFGSVVEEDDDVLGVAWDIDPRRADVRALGEAVERAALHEAPTAITRSSAADLAGAAIDLTDRVTFSVEQCSTQRELHPFAWDSRTDTSWVQMRTTRADLFVPADLERMRIEASDALRPKPMTSVGTACGVDWDWTLTRALSEVVERHAVARAVYSGQRAMSVDPSDERNKVSDIASMFGKRAEVRVGLLPGEHFGLNVAVAAVVGSEEGLPQTSFGTAAHANPSDAIRAATIEAVHIFHLGWRLLRRGDPGSEQTSINSRALWWARNGGSYLDHYFDSDHTQIPQQNSSSEFTWRDIAQSLEERGHSWAYSEITPDWAKGVRVARAVAPSLLHLQINQYPFHVAPRFADDVDTFVARSTPEQPNSHPFV